MSRTPRVTTGATLLAMMLVLGGTGEVVGLAAGALANIDAVRPLQRLHASTAVQVIVAVVGLSSIVLGSLMARGVLQLRRCPATGLSSIRRAAWGVVGMLVLAQLSLCVCLYPNLEQLQLPEPFPGFWIGSLAGAAVPPLLIAVGLVTLAGRELRTLP